MGRITPAVDTCMRRVAAPPPAAETGRSQDKRYTGGRGPGLCPLDLARAPQHGKGEAKPPAESGALSEGKRKVGA